MEEGKKEDQKNNELIHQQSFTVRIHEIDQYGTITIPSLLCLLQETSMQHIIKLKASVWDLKEHSISWVLLSKQLKIERLPTRGEKITVLTYPTGFEKFFAYRDYLVFDSEKNLILTASTRWSLIDTNTRKLTRVPERLLHLSIGSDVKKLSRPASKIPKPADSMVVSQEIIGSYDLDWNGHVNNVKLCRIMLQSLLTSGMKEDEIKLVDIQFKNESHEGDRLDVSVYREGNLVVVKRNEKLISSLKVS